MTTANARRSRERDQALDQATEWVRNANCLLIGAGAGFGVDSGLPDFRGRDGFWAAYPPFAALGLAFEELANPALFRSDPSLAWGFYGHRLNLYRRTVPHDGFAILKSWISRLSGGGFIFTSNVDGQFQTAGFGEHVILECHGSIHQVQHLDRRNGAVWSAAELQVDVDAGTMRARSPLPQRDGVLLRPNILMFGDDGWNPRRVVAQREQYDRWIRERARGRILVIEVGAGTAIPTVRHESERLVRRCGARLIRINPRDPHGPPGSISLTMAALEALRAIQQRLQA